MYTCSYETSEWPAKCNMYIYLYVYTCTYVHIILVPCIKVWVLVWVRLPRKHAAERRHTRWHGKVGTAANPVSPYHQSRPSSDKQLLCWSGGRPCPPWGRGSCGKEGEHARTSTWHRSCPRSWSSRCHASSFQRLHCVLPGDIAYTNIIVCKCTCENDSEHAYQRLSICSLLSPATAINILIIKKFTLDSLFDCILGVLL